MFPSTRRCPLFTVTSGPLMGRPGPSDPRLVSDPDDLDADHPGLDAAFGPSGGGARW
jgi:hypothetical protein